ncbi:MAG: hypothetical protein QY322_02685 [bacterium]|nr:MAG: hypothetical protein QY322_02685 [bacterium]
MLDFLQKQKPNTENFWALLIEPEWITSAVWQIKDGKVEVIAKSPPTRWEDNLLEAIDTSLSACSQFLPEESMDPSRTVFGLSNNWIEDGNIKPEKLEELKVICEKLSLVPSGFVVLSEAISHFLKSEDHGDTNALVLGLSDQNIEIAIFNLGTLSGVTNVLRSVSVEDDLMEGLTRLKDTVENFPSRIVLYNQKEQELEDVKEILNNSDWEKVGQSKFIHTPKIEVFDPEKKIIAVALAGGSELGAVGGVEDSQLPDETVVESLESEEVENIQEPNKLTAEELGFVKEEPDLPITQKIQLPDLKNKIKGLTTFSRPSIKMPKLNLNNKMLVVAGSGALTLVVASFLLWWFLPKAVVTIYVSPKQIEENIEIQSDSSIKTSENEISVSGEKTISTTGTKTVGEKSKGKVKVQNGTAFPINLAAGSTLLSSSDLKFVTLSSASISGALSPSNPGTGEIEVEAGSIGSEYNISKDEIFKVGNYPKAEVDAISLDGFGGGSSRQISAVSESDRKKILDELTEELLNDAKSQISQKLDSNQILIDSSVEIVSRDEQFSNKVGDEATSIKLSLKLDVKIISISKDELLAKSKEILNDKIPTNFVLKDDQIEYEIMAEDDLFNVRVTANLLPDIDEGEIAKKIAGKYPELAEDYFSSITGFTKAEFKIKPLFPGKLGTLPHIPKRMTVSFAVEE